MRDFYAHCIVPQIPSESAYVLLYEAEGLDSQTLMPQQVAAIADREVRPLSELNRKDSTCAVM
jgi:hypothetical protein